MLLFILINPIIHFDVLIFDVPGLQLNLFLHGIIPVPVLSANTCAEGGDVCPCLCLFKRVVIRLVPT